MNHSDPIRAALKLPGGARFYRCALQVNPFEYLETHNKQTDFEDEDEYNEAIVQACLDNDIEVIAVTDHYRIQTASSLMRAARKADIHVFPGFEAVTKEGVHLLCLFDDDKDSGTLERAIGACGVHDVTADSPVGCLDVTELLEEVQKPKWGALCLAAHVAAKLGGLLMKLSGQSRGNAWKSEHLLACSLPGPADEAPENLKHILANKDPEHKREHPVAILNAQDVCSPQDLLKPGATTWIKMSTLSIEGLRQAFLDPQSRIRLAGDPEPEERAASIAMAWKGGFLDGEALHFNETLNVLIGGSGTGKSTVIESIRYVLDLEPAGEEALKAHQGIVRNVLRSGTKISLRVASYRPAKRTYLIERTVPNPPVVRDKKGKVQSLTPSDIIPQVEVYGQHEISELAKSPEKRTRLLDRFRERDQDLARQKADIKRELERSRRRIIDVLKELEQIEERLASLPALEEMLKRFQEAGLEERLKEQSLLVREERVMKTAADRVEPFREILEDLRRELPIDRAFLSQRALKDLPGRKLLAEADEVLDALNKGIEKLADQMADTLEQADQGLADVRDKWEERKKKTQADYEKILRELQKSKVDGEEFIQLRKQIEELRPLKERKELLQRDLKEHEDNRRNLLAEWEDLKAEEFRQLERAAKKVTRQLKGRVQVTVTSAGDRSPLINLLRGELSGRFSEAEKTLGQHEDLSLRAFADACRSGSKALAKQYGLTKGQADKISQAPPALVMQVEELYLPPTTRLELNIAAEGQRPYWQALDDLSTGQKATAVLLLLLLESDAPLVVDQPEDDLDNRFITEGIVPKMREEKRRRQFIFATHNANIPVLSDAELIVGLNASGEADHGKGRIPRAQMGSIDAEPVRSLVEEVLEGGRKAFRTRRLKYGF